MNNVASPIYSKLSPHDQQRVNNILCARWIVLDDQGLLFDTRDEDEEFVFQTKNQAMDFVAYLRNDQRKHRTTKMVSGGHYYYFIPSKSRPFTRYCAEIIRVSSATIDQYRLMAAREILRGNC